MKEIKKTWTRAHDLALVFIALAYGTDEDLTAEELATITDILQDWREDLPADEAQDVVMEAVAVYQKAERDQEVVRSIDSLRDLLTEDERSRALQDVRRIAEADGIVLRAELDLIAHLASAWEVRQLGDALIEQMGRLVGEKPEWSLLHDMALVYLMLAHSTDNRISESEIAAMIERLNDWQPELDEEAIRSVLRAALAVYSQGLDGEDLKRSVQFIRNSLDGVHRLVLLDDLAYIAGVDGSVSETAHEMLQTFSQAWGVDVRLNGKA